MEEKDERLETAIKMIEMHLGIFLKKEDLIKDEDKKTKRKKRTNKFGNEFSKMEGKLMSNRSRAYEEEFIRIYADLEKKAKTEN